MQCFDTDNPKNKNMEPPGLDGDDQSSTISPISDSNINHANDPLLDPMGDDLSHDWAQWMHWDDHDHIDSISDHVDGSISSRHLSWDESQLMRNLEGERKVPLPYSPPNGSMPQQQTACPSAISPVSMGNLDLPLDQAVYPGTLRQVSTANMSPNGMPVGGGLGSPISPQSTATGNRKRKSSSIDDVTAHVEVDSKKLPAKKRSHNVIEKRYRANLNEKIAELRDSVPSLRVAASTQQKGGDEDEGSGATPANKLNKASILSKATAYIQHLELRNRRLDEENLALKTRLRQQDRALDQNVTATNSGSISSPEAGTVSTESGTGSSPSVFSHIEETPPGEGTSKSLYPPEGLLKVPEYFKTFRTTEPQPHYADTQVEYQNTECDRASGGGKRRRGNFPNKFMVGALAGIMVVEGLGKQRQTESTEKGLFAVPFQFIKSIPLPSAGSLQYAFANSRHLWALFGFGITFGLAFASAFLVFLYLFYARPLRQKQATGATAVAGSSNEFRQRAWLTSIQTVGVPSHTFFPEWFAVTSRCFEYCLRRTLGWSLYSWLTGITEDDEKGRVKAWDIAIDAQLTGGDSEISKSRLTLTIFASGTLPASPARVMLKALHCRILLYMVGSPGSFSFRTSNHAAGILARYQWNFARQLHKSWPEDDPEVLPPHLAALLETECDDVMMDSIIQRATNMTWSRPTQEATEGEEALLDVVAEDTSIRSPLDALAAWWSSHNLQMGLVEALESGSSFPLCTEGQKNLQSSIDLAINIAPPTSSPYTRALAAKAIFSDENRSKNISSVLAALPTAKDKTNDLPPNPCKSINFVDSSTPVSIRSEIGLAARCAIITAILKRESMRDVALPASKAKQKAIALFNEFPLDPVDLTLLGFVSIYYLLHVVAADELRVSSPTDSSPSNNTSSTDEDGKTNSLDNSHCSQDTLNSNRPVPRLDRAASGLIYWIRNAYGPASYGFTSDLVKKVEEECYTICRSVGIELVLDEKKKAKKKKKSKSKPKSGKNEIKKGISLEKTRRESMRSNDTGYGSLGEADGGVQEKTRSLDRIEDIDQG